LAALEQPLLEGVLAGLRVSVVYADDGWRQNWQEPLDELLERAGAVVVGSRMLGRLAAEQGDHRSFALNLQALTDDRNSLLGEEVQEEAGRLVDIILLVGSGEATADWERQLASQAKETGVGFAVIGTADMGDRLYELAKLGALALDNLDDAAGRIALVLGLSAEKTGYYGVGKHAKALWAAVSRDSRR